MAEVIGLGYVVVEAQDLDAWRKFARDLLGLQPTVDTPDRLLLRMDEKAYRLDIRRGDTDQVTAIGWEVKGPKELEEIAARLESNGYSVKRATDDAVTRRQVSGLVEFDDPAGQRLELFWGLLEARQRFVSPTGARFVTGRGGMGHVFQFTDDGAAQGRLYQDILGFRLSDLIEFAPGASGTFLHANERHHSFAYASVPGLTGFGHLMFEVTELDLVGRAWDKVQDGAAPIAATFGKHTNDEMLSFYVVTPSGFQVEYGFGGKLVDDATWAPARYDAASYWGHRRADPSEPDV
ncbi:VOC family protein [Streptomyces sp. NPDC051662]|uniref:VOC family protein n=1 Tax=Streptomyces sp. NPDC051662 TaxID=3154750 RepID=UPI003445B322